MLLDNVARASGRRRLSAYALATVSFAAMLSYSQSVRAQQNGPPIPEQEEEIVVTGSRVVRDGYDAPTPVTVLGIDVLEDAAEMNVADLVNSLPSFRGSSTPTSGFGINPGTGGGNFLNLRGLGLNRTLVLFNGRRFVGSNFEGAVDANQFPDGLIARVDVVTGGASAVYGSDALSGVVNFILDDQFEGVKGELSGGITARGDGKEYKGTLSAGSSFANGRGHFVINGGYAASDPIEGWDREWNQNGETVINNPAYAPGSGQPRLISRAHVGMGQSYPGGMITSGPLKGIVFGPGGVPRQYDYGELFSAPHIVGGDWKDSTLQGQARIRGEVNRNFLFSHAQYDVSDNVQVWADYTYAMTRARTACCDNFFFGNLTVRMDNPLIPATVAAQGRQLGLTSFSFGTTNDDVERLISNNKRMSHAYAAGLRGTLDALETNWSWNAYVQRSIGTASISTVQINRTRYALAIDAVTAPNGAIVCRSSLTSPANGCIPYNLFGQGVNSKEAIEYVWGPGWANNRFSTDAAGIDISGEPFSTWAGSVSLALGADYRVDDITGENDPDSKTFSWFAASYQVFTASIDVIEGFAETVVPLAANEVWAQSLDVSAAVRATNYSQSGYVTTWKAGLNYSPIDDVRFRATRSRDIRAPNLTEAFSLGQVQGNNFSDPFTGQSVFRAAITQGNPNLKPEKADTTGLGVVYQPGWLSGFSAAVDYYRINIKGAVGSVGADERARRCALAGGKPGTVGSGDLFWCRSVVPTDNGYIIYVQPENFVSEIASGIDFEATYTTPLTAINDAWPGDLTLRVLATRTLENNINDVRGEIDRAGAGTAVYWVMRGAATYDLEPFSVSFTGRYVGPFRNSATQLECSTGCPDSTARFETVDDNSTGSHFELDATLSYTITPNDSKNSVEAYLAVNNLLDTDPPRLATTQGFASSPHAETTLHDLIGQSFRLGLRFRM